MKIQFVSILAVVLGTGFSQAILVGHWDFADGSATTNDASRLPTVSTPGSNLVFSFLKDTSVTDAAWSIGIGTGLDAWPAVYQAGDPEVGVVEDAETGFDRVTLTLSRAPDSKKFARLRVTIP